MSLFRRHKSEVDNTIPEKWLDAIADRVLEKSPVQPLPIEKRPTRIRVGGTDIDLSSNSALRSPYKKRKPTLKSGPLLYLPRYQQVQTTTTIPSLRNAMRITEQKKADEHERVRLRTLRLIRRERAIKAAQPSPPTSIERVALLWWFDHFGGAEAFGSFSEELIVIENLDAYTSRFAADRKDTKAAMEVTWGLHEDELKPMFASLQNFSKYAAAQKTLATGEYAFSDIAKVALAEGYMGKAGFGIGPKSKRGARTWVKLGVRRS